MKILRTPLRAVLLASLMVVVSAPVIAQTTNPSPDRTVVDVNDDDDGFDWGLLGLLGLLGLIPRKQRYVDRDPTRGNTTTR